MDFIEIHDSPGLLLAGLTFFGDPFHTHAGWTATNEIGRLWSRLMQHPLPAEEVFYELHITHPDTSQTGEFEVFVGFAIDALQAMPLELCLKQLPPTRYAVFTLRGVELGQDDPLIAAWLQERNYRVDPPFFLQRYDARFKGTDRLAESELDYLIPLLPDGA